MFSHEVPHCTDEAPIWHPYNQKPEGDHVPADREGPPPVPGRADAEGWMTGDSYSLAGECSRKGHCLEL